MRIEALHIRRLFRAHAGVQLPIVPLPVEGRRQPRQVPAMHRGIAAGIPRSGGVAHGAGMAAILRNGSRLRLRADVEMVGGAASDGREIAGNRP